MRRIKVQVYIKDGVDEDKDVSSGLHKRWSIREQRCKFRLYIKDGKGKKENLQQKTRRRTRRRSKTLDICQKGVVKKKKAEKKHISLSTSSPLVLVLLWLLSYLPRERKTAL